MNPQRIDLIKDAPSRARLLKLHPALRQSAVDCYLAAEAALSGKNSLRVTYSLRTFDEQAALFLKGRKANGDGTFSVVNSKAIVTKANAGQSYHNYGLALDFVLQHTDGRVSYSLAEDLDADGIADWKEVAGAFKAAGWSWGGEWNFKDNPHVEKRPAGLHWSELRRRFNTGKRDAEGFVLIPEASA